MIPRHNFVILLSFGILVEIVTIVVLFGLAVAASVVVMVGAHVVLVKILAMGILIIHIFVAIAVRDMDMTLGSECAVGHIHIPIDALVGQLGFPLKLHGALLQLLLHQLRLRHLGAVVSQVGYWCPGGAGHTMFWRAPSSVAAAGAAHSRWVMSRKGGRFIPGACSSGNVKGRLRLSLRKPGCEVTQLVVGCAVKGGCGRRADHRLRRVVTEEFDVFLCELKAKTRKFGNVLAAVTVRAVKIGEFERLAMFARRFAVARSEAPWSQLRWSS
jgi:hypothetical protein